VSFIEPDTGRFSLPCPPFAATVSPRARPSACAGSRSFTNVERRSRSRIASGSTDRGPPDLWRARAAIEAACGAAALVPKKFGRVSGSRAVSRVKNVVLPPSADATWGVRRICGRGYRFPEESK
jgi:hypothetical protein